MMSNMHVTAKVNGDEVEFLCDPRETLLDVLRDRLNLTGTKEGCGTGDCGACTVTIDDRLVCSCLMLGVEASGKSVETIEGIFLFNVSFTTGWVRPASTTAAKREISTVRTTSAGLRFPSAVIFSIIPFRRYATFTLIPVSSVKASVSGCIRNG